MSNHDLQTQGELIINEPEDFWGKLDRRIADDDRISIESRGVLAWIATRPRGHRLFVRYLQKRCCLSQARWQRLRRELEAHGYLAVRRLRVQGKFTWQYHVNLVYGAPMAAIGRFSTDGKTTGSKPTDIERIAVGENNTTTTTPPYAPPTAGRKRRRSQAEVTRPAGGFGQPGRL